MEDRRKQGSPYRCIPRTEFRKQDDIINKGPCIVYDMVLSGNGAGVDIDIHDGLDVKDEVKFHLETLTGTSISWNSKRGTFFRKGIYINVSAANAEVSITFAPFEFEGRQER